MATDMHLYITELMNGNLVTEVPEFKLEKHELITPDLATMQSLLDRLGSSDKISRERLLRHLPAFNFPEGTNLEPLKERVRKGDTTERRYALEAFATAGQDGERFLLDVLRKTNDRRVVHTIAGVLAGCGSIFALPVLMARLENDNPGTGNVIHRSLKNITARLNINPQVGEQNFWKVKWQGSKESFLGFMSFMALMSGNMDDENATDQLGEIFLEELNVNISPFQSYRELRLCGSGEDIFSGMAMIHESLQSELLLEAALSGTGITESRETQVQGIYLEMVNDYLFTRLRRKIQFSDDDY